MASCLLGTSDWIEVFLGFIIVNTVYHVQSQIRCDATTVNLFGL